MAVKPIVKTFEYFFDRLLRGFRKDQGREPNNLEMILIRQEAGGKAKDANKIIQFPYKKSFGQEVDEMIAKGEVNVGTANKTPPYEKSQADIEFEIMEKIKSDNEKAVKAFESRNPNKKPKDEDPGFYTGGMVDVEPNLSDIGHGSDALMARTRLVSPGSQATTSTGLNYLLAEDNDNIRVPFANGNGVADEDAEKAALGKRVRELMDEGFDMGEAVRKAMSEGYAEGGRIGFAKGKIAKEVLDKSRRGFIKAAGAAGAGLAALKTGLLGLGEKAAPVVEKAVETVQGTPQYFFDLVAKIKMFGKQSKIGPQERVNEFSYTGKNGDEYVLTEDIVTGDAQITKDKMGGVRVSEDEMTDGIVDRSVMEYKSGKGMADEGTGGALPDEYDEYKVEFDMDGTMADADDMDEIIKKEIIQEISEKITKKASGGIARMIGE